jgi:uncharacterized membrane protein YhaH (DUF805 family)
MNWMWLPLKRYADFSGRSRRKEFWMFTLFQLLLNVGLIILLAIGLSMRDGSQGLGTVGWIVVVAWLVTVLALFVPAIAVQVRRFHDQDKSGWLVLLNLIPSLGGLIVMVMMCMEGTYGANRYGPDPKLGEPGH